MLGIGNLTTKTTKILFQHIKTSLPEITKEIKAKMKDAEDDLRDLGPPVAASDAEKAQLLWSMVTEFINSYKNAISGKYDTRRSKNENISGGARIKMSFYNLYSEFLGFRACS